MSGVSSSSLVAGFVGLSVLVAGCSEPTPIADDAFVVEEEVELGFGDVVLLDGNRLELSFVDVIEDSRCAVDVVCVWEGNARVALLSAVAGVERAFALNTSPGAPGAGAADVDGYTIELVAVVPEPVSDRPIPAADYRVRLRISRD